MKKLVCDICKKEVEPNVSLDKPIYSILKIFGSRSGTLLLGADMCPECSNTVIRYIEGMSK